MFILFGLRSVIVFLAAPVYACERCHSRGEHQVTKRVRKLTLFFVPVFPVGPSKYVDTCTVCGRTIEVSKTQAEAAAAPR